MLYWENEKRLLSRKNELNLEYQICWENELKNPISALTGSPLKSGKSLHLVLESIETSQLALQKKEDDMVRELNDVVYTLGGIEEYVTVLQELRNKMKETYNFQLSLDAFAGILGFVSDDIRNNVVSKPRNAEEWVVAMLREFNHQRTQPCEEKTKQRKQRN